MYKKIFSLLVVVTVLMILPGCWKPKDGHSCGGCGDHSHYAQDASACCISLNGKPAFTQADFHAKFDELCQARPDIKNALEGLPAEQQQGFYQQFSEALLTELLISRHMKDSGILNTPEYKKASKQAHAAVETQLLNSLFQSNVLKQIEQEITDEAAEKYYEENRDRLALFKRPPFIDKMGGVKVLIVDGLTQTQANSVVERAKKGDFERLAHEVQRKVKNLGMVTQRSVEVDEQIRAKVLGYTNVPHVDVVKLTNGKYAVIKAVALEKDTFKPFSDPEVKQAVKSFLIRNELGKAITKTMEDLKQKYGAVIHHEVIMKSVKKAPTHAHHHTHSA